MTREISPGVLLASIAVIGLAVYLLRHFGVL